VTVTTDAFPVVFRHHIVFACSVAHQQMLQSDAVTPLRAHRQCVPAPLLASRQLQVVPRLCVVGPLLSGKTTVALDLAQRHGLVYLTLPAVLQYAKSGLQPSWPTGSGTAPSEAAVGAGSTAPRSAVGAAVRAALRTGQPLADEVCVQALRLVTSMTTCQRHGWILDGWPRSEHQARLLTQGGLTVPHALLVLQLGPHAAAVTRRRMAEATLASHPDAAQYIGVDLEASLADWHEQGWALQRYAAQYWNNIITVDTAAGEMVDGVPASNISRWQQSTRLDSLLRTHVSQRLRYLAATAPCGSLVREGSGPLPLAAFEHQATPVTFHATGGIGSSSGSAVCGSGLTALTPARIRARLGAYGAYCPVCWHRDRALHSRRRTFTAEYRRLFYRCCDAECLAAFVSEPAVFITSPLPPPDQLPHRLATSDAHRLLAEHIELQGHCPVRLTQALAHSVAGAVPLQRGQEQYGVVYRGRVYLCKGEAEASAFLAHPDKYTSATLRVPIKATPQVHILTSLCNAACLEWFVCRVFYGLWCESR
jgi:hypothetical protein